MFRWGAYRDFFSNFEILLRCLWSKDRLRHFLFDVKFRPVKINPEPLPLIKGLSASTSIQFFYNFPSHFIRACYHFIQLFSSFTHHFLFDVKFRPVKINPEPFSLIKHGRSIRPTSIQLFYNFPPNFIRTCYHLI